MNRLLNNRAEKIIKRGYLIYIIALFAIVAAIAGGTYAWFVDSSLTFDNVFTAGTVNVDFNPDPDKATVIVAINGCDEYRWYLKNIGSKSSYVRAKIVRTEIEVEGETAWAFGSNKYSDSFIDLGISNKWGWVVYYKVGSSDFTAYLYAGAGQNDLSKGTVVGTVTIKTITVAPALGVPDDTTEATEDQIESRDH
jgi:predicted ribosomally synthesized peptide with SipW-like signal peptide